MSVGSKLAGLIFGSYALASFFIILIGMYLFFNVEVESNLLITVFSGILVGSFATTTVIWRTLRESLHTKLKYWHDKHFRDFHSTFAGFIAGSYSVVRIKGEDIREKQTALRRYGKFMAIISLCPEKALEKIDEFLSSLDTFYGNLRKVSDLTGINLDDRGRLEALLFHFNLSPPGPSGGEEQKEMAHELLKKQSDLVAKMKEYHKNLMETSKQIHNLLEEFFARNDLSY